jgi:hypothetical protein
MNYYDTLIEVADRQAAGGRLVCPRRRGRRSPSLLQHAMRRLLRTRGVA